MTTQTELTTSISIPAEKNVLSLPEFMKQYGDKLPLSIKVITGYLDESSQVTISASDIWNVHFVKKTNMVVATSRSGDFTIPTNSALEFCLVYNPQNNLEQALKGFDFKTVLDILKAKIPPKLVCCTQVWIMDHSTIAKGELLVILSAHQKRNKRDNSLRVYSITFSEEKSLPMDCEGHFTTCASSLHLYLQEIVQLIPDLFPCQMCIYMQKSGVHELLMNLPHYLSSEIFTLTGTTVETALVASPVYQGAEGIIMKIPIDIPEVEVAVIHSPHAQELYANTCQLLEVYNPKTMQNFNDAKNDEQYSAQSLFYSTIRSGYEKDGIQSFKHYDYIRVQHKSNLDCIDPIYEDTILEQLPKSAIDDKNDVEPSKKTLSEHTLDQHIAQHHSTIKTLSTMTPDMCLDQQDSASACQTGTMQTDADHYQYIDLHGSMQVSMHCLERMNAALLEMQNKMMEMEQKLKYLTYQIKRIESLTGLSERLDETDIENN